MMTGRIITFQLLLHDEPGVLSSILGAFASHAANILTINQTIPSGGCAAVTVTAETMAMQEPIEVLLQQLSATLGVVKAEILAG
jgi:chorismate mutase